MKRKGPPFEAARSGRALYVRVRGLGSMANAATMEGLVNQEIEAGVRQLVVDLSDCDGVDSTFMGLLLSFSNRFGERPSKKGRPRGLVLINVDEHALKQLSSVGLDHMLTILPGESEVPGSVRLTPVDTREVSEKDRLKLMVRAHKELVAADPRNQAKFGAFLAAIVAELGE